MKRDKIPIKRVYALVAFMALWGAGIAARLYFLQVVQSAAYIEKAQNQQQATIRMTPRRGAILDRGGNELALSVRVDSVIANPSQMKDPQETARVLSRLTQVPYEDLLRRFDPKKSFAWVKRKVSEQERAAIERADLPGVGFEKEFRRIYPNRELAAHLLGYVDIDEEGRTGLEGRYNGPVHGQPGKVSYLVDAHGRRFERQEQIPQAGADLVTTIDKTIQYIVEKEIRLVAEKTRAAAVSVIVMDPGSGAILAMGNYPTYNPNDYADSDPAAWINRSLSLTYEPGSTFKMVTVAAALEEGLTTPDEVIYCEDGSIVVYGRRIRDHEEYGNLTVKEIIQNSSNVGTIKLGLRVGEERLAGYIERLGFGKPTQVDLPAEVGGLVRPVSQWTKTSIASIAIGQEISVTPLQIVSLLSTIANGGILYTPYVVQEIDDPLGGTATLKPNGRRVLSPETAQQLREMLEDVVTDGTARTSRLDAYRAAGKTGTAQKIDPATRTYSRTKYVASFAGFAPASNPRLAMVVVVDEPKGLYYGGQVAAPVFKRIAEQVLPSMAIPADEPDYAPNYTVASETRALRPDPVRASAASSFVSTATGVSPAWEWGEIVVPDFSGKSLRQVAEASGRLSLRLQSAGSGRAIAQSPPPGSQVRPGTRLQVWFSVR